MDDKIRRLMNQWADELRDRERMDKSYLQELEMRGKKACAKGLHAQELEYKLEYAVACYARGEYRAAASMFDRAAHVASELRQDGDRAIFCACAAILYENIGQLENAAYARMRAAESYAYESEKRQDAYLLEHAGLLLYRADRLFESAGINPRSINTRERILNTINRCSGA